MTNWELDVAIVDRNVAAEMEQLFLQDLASAVEISLPLHRSRIGRRALHRRSTALPGDRRAREEILAAREARRRARRGTRFGRFVSRVSRASIVLARTLVGQKSVGAEESGWIGAIAILLLGLAILGFVAPRLLAWPLAFILFWIGIASLYRAAIQRRDG
jgi:cardiolipin synthase A/B